jgi:hypothetical protein
LKGEDIEVQKEAKEAQGRDKSIEAIQGFAGNLKVIEDNPIEETDTLIPALKLTKPAKVGMPIQAGRITTLLHMILLKTIAIIETGIKIPALDMIKIGTNKPVNI